MFFWGFVRSIQQLLFCALRSVGYRRLLLAMCCDATATELLNFLQHCNPIHK